MTITVTDRDGVAVITMDDGKANALSFEAIDRLGAALDEAGDRPVVLTGREGMFCAGFDLSVMRAGDASEVARLVAAGARLVVRLFSHPRPVVVAVTGHALAAGAFLVLAGDARFAAPGDYQIGLPETRIGMVLPPWAITMCDYRLSRRHLQLATVGARSWGPAGAVEAGFVDAIGTVDDAVAEARSLGEMPAAAYAGIKAAQRAEVLDRLRSQTG